MMDNEGKFEQADREKRIIEERERAIEQIAKTQNVSPLAFTRGTTYDDAIHTLASSLARVERTLSREPIAHDSRDLVIDDLIQRSDRQERRIESLERELADLRSTQQPADPTGASPYRSASQRHAAPAGSPVATSDALPTPTSASGAWRRVYGALSGRGVALGGWACMGAAAGHVVMDQPIAAGAYTFAGVALWILQSVLDQCFPRRSGAES